MKQHRRIFLKQAGSFMAVSLIMPMIKSMASVTGKRNPKILLRSSWQTVNIGDTSHTFGIMALLQTYLPEAEITLWAKNLDRGVDILMAQTFPKLNIINGGAIDNAGKSSDSRLEKAFTENDFMLHGSAYNVTARKDLIAWYAATKKPYGIYGVSLDEVDDQLKEVINRSSFIYCRDTESLKYLKSLKLSCPIQAFAPDATFGTKLRNEEKGKAYLKSVNLEDDKFICVIPKLRYTPYWQMNNTQPTDDEKKKYELSQAYKEADNAKLREVITRWVKETGQKVLVCAEVTYQVGLGKEVVDALPDAIKQQVVWRDTFWNPDEAGSVYARSRALVTLEQHSAIICFAEGIPAIVLKQPTDTRKGQMWRDVGLGDWYFEIEETPGSQIANMLMEIHHNYDAALKKLNTCRQQVIQIQKETMSHVKSAAIASVKNE
ncbi:MAG: polysaccharide pyruvyl transferase family protein [Bacteroidota bacterium]